MILAVLLCGCTGGAISVNVSDAGQCDPCKRQVIAVIGQAGWLIDAIASDDATASHEAATELARRIDAMEDCKGQFPN
jgi:hypothetical protein